MAKTGRTARIGNEGLATSFYNDKDSDLAPDLVKILLESKQSIPDFLESYKPEGSVVTFDEDDTDNEGDANDDDANANGGDASGDAWGAPNDGAQADFDWE